MGNLKEEPEERKLTAKEKELTPAEKLMATKRVKTLVLTYSIPTIIGMLVSALYNIIDRFWVGQMPDAGTNALTGIGLCMPIMNVMAAFCMLIGIGASSSISIHMGKRDKAGAEKILGNAFVLLISFSLALIVLGQIFAEPVLRAVGASDATLPYALSYVRIIIGGWFFGFISFAMNHPIRAMGNPKRFASTQLLGAIANMILDPIFIFVLDMGIAGAAVATVISQTLSAIWVMCFYFNIGGKTPIKLKFKNFKLDFKIILTIFSIGMSPFFMQMLASVISIIINRTLQHYGEIQFGNGDVAIGAMTVISSISTLFLMPIFGINQGSQPIVGFNYGAGNLTRVKEAYKWSVIYSVIICSVGFIVVQLFAGNLIKMFNDDPLLVDIGSHGMRIMFVFLPLIGFQIPTSNFFQSIGRALITVILSLLRQFIILIPAYLLLPMIFGFEGIWFAMPIADFFSVIVTAFMIIREFKLLTVKFRKERLAEC